MNNLLTKNYVASAAVPPRRFVKFGASALAVMLATGAGDAIIGVSTDIAADAAERCDVIHVGLVEIELGGAVTRGDQLTSDAVGRAVKATLSANAVVRTAGVAIESGVQGDIIWALVALNAAVGSLHAQTGGVFGATITVGAENAGVINVGIQLTDDANDDLAVRGSVLAYLSDDANGDSVAAAAPSGGVAIGTDGLAIPLVAGKTLQLTSEADGDIDLDITEASAKSFYLVLVMPNGTLAVSDAITFAG